jgi:hypothetical protein
MINQTLMTNFNQSDYLANPVSKVNGNSLDIITKSHTMVNN